MKIQQHIPLAPYTTFHIGGTADYFIAVHSIQELISAIEFAKEKELAFFVLGTGANILVGDKGFRGLVIKNEASKFQISIRQSADKFPISNNEQYVFLTAESGTTIEQLINFTKEKGLSGFEHFAGIPSSVGGALWQNLHFLSPDRTKTVFIGDIVESAEILKIEVGSKKLEKEDIVLVEKDYFKFAYDYSILHDNKDLVLSASLKLTRKDPRIIQKTILANLAWRKEKHPENSTKTSAGSVFKKIAAHGAGRLIDKVGLKGYQIGGAMISPKHANFIVNIGNATAQDVRKLISLIQEKVKKELGFELQTEISFVGEF